MGKNIIVCFDGTGNRFGENNTNVVHTMESILKTNQQVSCYDPGVGTIDFFGKVRRNSLSIALGKAFGYGIDINIIDGYKFLMRQFHPDSSGFVEGFNNKVKVLKRRCYGISSAKKLFQRLIVDTMGMDRFAPGAINF